MNLSYLPINLLKSAQKHSPEILTGLGIAGVALTSYLVGKASFRASKEIERVTKFDDDGNERDTPLVLTKKELIKGVWPAYVPAAIAGTVTVACIVGASKASRTKTAAAVAAYSITEKAFSEYKEKVVEQIGINKEQRIRDDLAQERVTNKPPGSSKELMIIGDGAVLCCDLYTHRYFRSDVESLRKSQNAINHRVLHEWYVALDEFYEMIDLPPTSYSGKVGWDSDRLLELIFSATLAENGEPCLAFEYNYLKPL